MKQLLVFFTLVFTLFLVQGWQKESISMTVSDTVTDNRPTDLPYAILAGGCFWCLESEFRALEGVVYTESGYTGGELNSPEYRDITTGKTGHAEAVKVYYDPDIISYKDLVDFYLRKAHDPTQLNRQGVDIGTQYRSAIFYESEDQKAQAQAVIDAVTADNAWNKPIVTTLEPAETFWRAEEYHQQYYEKYEEQNGRPHIRVLYKQQNKK